MRKLIVKRGEAQLKKNSFKAKALNAVKCKQHFENVSITDKLLFNLLKDLLKQFENIDRAVNVLGEFENEEFFDLRKKNSIFCQILSSKKTMYCFNIFCFST